MAVPTELLPGLDANTYQALVEDLGELGHWSLEVANQRLHWSAQVYRIHGQTPESYCPEMATALQYYHPNDRHRLTSQLDATLCQGGSFQLELRIVRRGSVRYVRASGRCQTDDQGQATHLVGVFQDLTRWIKIGDYRDIALAHPEYLESSNDGYWDWYIQDDYEYMSPRFWEILGYQPEEKEHKPSAWQDIVFQDDLAVVMGNFNKHVQTHGAHPFEQQVRYRHKNGSTVTVLCRGKIVQWGDNGEPVRMIGTHTDITQLKTIQRELRTANKDLHQALRFQQLLMDINTDLIFVKDKNFKITQANPAFFALYPPPRHDGLLGCTAFESLTHEQAEAFKSKDKKAFTDGYCEVVEQVGSRIFLIKKIRFADDNNEPFILGVARDITQWRRTEKQLERNHQELEEFTYRTCHDLRSPLVSSKRLLDIVLAALRQGDLDKAIGYVELVLQSTTKLETLVKDISRLTRLRHTALNPRALDFGELVRDVVGSIRLLAGYDRVIWDTQVHFADSIVLDKGLLVSVLENLLSNAVKYQNPEDPHSTVTIVARADTQQLQFSVQDTGIGFPANAQDTLFDMFKRYHPKVSSGSGLGLYMVRHCVRKLGGDIEYTQLPQGSRFNVVIPLASVNPADLTQGWPNKRGLK